MDAMLTACTTLNQVRRFHLGRVHLAFTAISFTRLQSPYNKVKLHYPDVPMPV